MDLVEFKGNKISTQVKDLMDQVFKQCPNLEFGYISSGYSTGKFHLNDGDVYYCKLAVYDSENLKTPIGVIGYDTEYFVASPNIKNGRNYWGHFNGQIKRSKHIKNIIKVAIGSLKALNFEQAMDDSKGRFRGNIQSKTWEYRSKIQTATGNCLDIVGVDMLELFKQGYKAKTTAFQNIMEYIANNQDYIKKYANYSPNYTGVWVCANRVEYLKNGDKDPTIVLDKQALPPELLGKICLMDIGSTGSFDEELGYKHSDSQYWVIHD